MRCFQTTPSDRDGALKEAVVGLLLGIITVIDRDHRPTAVDPATQISSL